MIRSVPSNAEILDEFHQLYTFNSNPGRALCTLRSSEKFKAIKEVIDSCRIFDCIEPRSAFIESVFKRESIESTGIGHGVAVAHGKLSSIPKVTIGLGISVEGIPFESIDGLPVNFLFVIGSSPENQDEYLYSLGSLMRFMRNPTFRSYLTKYPSELFKNAEEYGSFFKMLGTQEFLSL